MLRQLEGKDASHGPALKEGKMKLLGNFRVISAYGLNTPFIQLWKPQKEFSWAHRSFIILETIERMVLCGYYLLLAGPCKTAICLAELGQGVLGLGIDTSSPESQQ